MKLIRLTEKGVLPVKTIINGKYHAVVHGTKSYGLWSLLFGVDKIITDSSVDKEPIILDGDKYILLPFMKNGEHVKDRKGNYLYYISISHLEQDRDGYIVFLEIPNKMYTDVKYTIDGNCRVISEGMTGLHRNGKLYSSPSPVLEVTGPCSIKYIYKNLDDEVFYKTHKYNGDTWTTV